MINDRRGNLDSHTTDGSHEVHGFGARSRSSHRQRAIPLQRRADEAGVEYEAELWCEFDCVAYVFVGTDREELAARIQAARAGELSWDYARPLSREELYGGLV